MNAKAAALANEAASGQGVKNDRMPGRTLAKGRSFRYVIMMKTIRQIADEFGLSLRTLRFYEQRGLIRSKRFSSDKSLRVYDEDDHAQIAKVVRLVRMGFTLSEIENDVMDVKKLRDQLQYCYGRMTELETAVLLIKEDIEKLVATKK